MKNKHFSSTIMGIEHVGLLAFLFVCVYPFICIWFLLWFFSFLPPVFQMSVTILTLLLSLNIPKQTSIFKLSCDTFFFYLKRCVWFRKYKNVALLFCIWAKLEVGSKMGYLLIRGRDVYQETEGSVGYGGEGARAKALPQTLCFIVSWRPEWQKDMEIWGFCLK